MRRERERQRERERERERERDGAAIPFIRTVPSIPAGKMTNI